MKTRTHGSIRIAAALAVLAVLLGACVPGAVADRGRTAIVLGVPSDALVPGAADGLHERLRAADTGFSFVPTVRARFLEVRRGLVDGMVTPGAARVARNTGAGLAVTIEATTLVREIVDADRSRPLQRTTLQLEVTILDASDATELARLAGPRLRHERRIDGPEPPALDEDPAIATLRDRSLDELAPRVARELRTLAPVSGSTVE